MAQEGSENIEQLYQKAVVSVADAYLAAENQLVRQGATAVRFLRARSGETKDPFERFFVATLSSWIESRPPEFLEAMTQIQQAEDRMKKTPAGKPRADVVEVIFARVAGDRLVDYMALRLAKGTLFPDWLEGGALRYVGEHGGPGQIPALERYVQIARNPQFREYALEVISRRKATR
jgi:hypothetical protein